LSSRTASTAAGTAARTAATTEATAGTIEATAGKTAATAGSPIGGPAGSSRMRFTSVGVTDPVLQLGHVIAEHRRPD
jgi:hypothetical protein